MLMMHSVFPDLVLHHRGLELSFKKNFQKYITLMDLIPHT